MTRRMLRWFGLSVGVAVASAGWFATPSLGVARAAHPVARRAPIGDVGDLSSARPRILLRKADVVIVDGRLERAPYSTLLQRMATQVAQAAPPSAADQADCGLTVNIGREEAKARAAKDLAFMYTVDRVWDATTASVVEPSVAQRQAVGDLARDYLVDTCTTSRTHIDAGRDINTSNEMIQMATAFDTLAGGGYRFHGSEPVIVGNLQRWTAQFYADYQPLLKFLTNNHLAKGAASIGTVAIARAYSAVAHGRGWQTRAGTVVADIWTSKWFTEMGRWELDMTRPDGTLAPFDDSNVDDAYYFGALASTSPDAGAYAWRWATAASFRSDWGTDAVAAFVQAEHGGSRGFGRAPGQPGIPFAAVHDHADPGSFQLDAYGERLLLDPGYINYTWTQHGLLSNPSADNLVLVGPAVDPESPGNPNTASTIGSLQLTAFTTSPTAPVPVDGEAYVTDTIDRAGVAAATVTSTYGRAPSYTPPNPLSGLDFEELPTADSATVSRRFLFIDQRYLVIADTLTSAAPRTYTWPLHGNGGGTAGMTDPQPALKVGQRGLEPADAIPATPYAASGGTFAQTAAGGEWSRSLARVDTGMAFDAPTTFTTSLSQGLYEQTHGQLGSDTVLSTSVQGTNVRAASVIYPTPTDGAAPTITRLSLAGAAVLRVDDPAHDHHVLIVVRAPNQRELYVPCAATGMPVSITTDAAIVVVDVHADGTPITHYFEQGTHLKLTAPGSRGSCQ